MIGSSAFPYQPDDSESEKASNGYLMSLIAIMAGMPLPILNLLATFLFFLGNRRGTYFVRWHCTQALLSQAFLLPVNTIGFWWTMNIIFGDFSLDNRYISYVLLVFLLNIGELFATIYSAIQTRKGRHVEWWFYGPLTHLICRPR